MAMDMNAAIRISAKVTGDQEVEKLRRSMGNLQGTVGMLKNALGVLGVAFSAQQFGSWIKGTIDYADSLNDLRQKTGIAVETLDALSLVAEENGTSLDAVSGGLAKLARVMGEAAAGGATAQASLSQFGISIKDVESGSITATEALARIADRISELPDGFKKAAAIQKVFGKGATELIPLMNAGGDAIRNADEILNGFGNRITGDFASAADSFNDNLARMKRLTGTLAVAMSEDLVPAINRVLEAFMEADKVGGTGNGIWAAIKQLSTNSIIDFANAEQALNDELEKQKRLRSDIAALSSDSLANRINNFDFGGLISSDLSTLKMQLAESEDVVKQLRNIILQKTPLTVTAPGKTDLGGGTSGDGGVGGNSDSGAIDRGNRALEERSRLLEEQANQIYDMRASQMEEVELLKLEGQAVNMSTFAYQQMVEAKKHEFEVSRATADMLPETAALYKEVADGIFAARQEVERLNEEQSKTAAYGAKSALKDYAESAADTAGQVGEVVSDAFQGMEDALVDFVRTGKLNFKDLVDTMIADIARLAIKKAILGPLAGALDAIITPNANGGVMTESGPMPLRTYSTGGIARTPQLALFGEGSMPEAYVPLPDGRSIPVSMKGGGGSNVQVVVNNHSGQQVQTNESTDGRGNRRVEVTIGDLVAQEIRRPGSSANLAIRQSFNSRQSLTGR